MSKSIFKPKVRSTAYPPDPTKDYNEWRRILFESNNRGDSRPPTNKPSEP